MRHIIPISGKDSLATAFVQTQRAPSLAYEFIYNDVEAELPETYAWLDKVEATTGWSIHRIGSNLEKTIVARNGFLPSGRQRYCTREGKIDPMHKYLNGDACTIYYGLRADENRTGYVPVANGNITPAYPLVQMGIGIDGVYRVLDSHGIAPPSFFWPRLYNAVKRRLDAVLPDWENQLTRMERDVLFSGRTRANCYFCFFQRQYEYIWLMETHPDLWERAKAFENVGSNYTWRDGYALADLETPGRATAIFDRRVLWVCGQIAKKCQLNLFDEDADNEIAGTSCGLLCGK